MADRGEELRQQILQLVREYHGEAFPDLMRAVSDIGARVVLQVGFNLRSDHPGAAAFAEELIDYKFTTMRNDERYRMDELGLRVIKLRHLPWLLAGLREVLA